MRKVKLLPSQEILKSFFHYDPESGLLIVQRDMRASIKWVALGRGRFQVNMRGENYYAHRIIWKWMTGEDPIEVDHIDGDGTNNKWNNLRNATSAENNRNRRISPLNKSGVKGVCWESARRKWRATIGNASNGRQLLWFGRFDTLEEAEITIKSKRAELHGEFARAS